MRRAGKLSSQPWMTAAATRAVVAALTAGGAEVRFVGGCVRDAVLRRPVSDVDIATQDAPDIVMALLAAAGIRAIPTGIDHGTVTAVVDKARFEITTLRRDVETFGRHARVAFTDDWRADAARRDLTMNAIFCAPDGTLYDDFGGLEDLRARRVRFVGDARTRIREDVLRLLRFFRFFAHYGAPPPDAEALAACRELADLLPTLSAERIWAEIKKLLAAPDPAPVLELMDREDILRHVIPELRAIGRLAALVAVEDKTGEGAEPDPLRRLAALVDADAEAVRGLATRLKLSNKERRRLVRPAAALPDFAPLEDAAARARWYYRHDPDGNLLYRDLLLLHWAGGGAISPTTAAAWAAAANEAAAWQKPKYPLAGRDVHALGVKRGPRVGELLRAVEDWWIDGDFRPDRKGCLAKLAEVAGEG